MMREDHWLEASEQKLLQGVIRVVQTHGTLQRLAPGHGMAALSGLAKIVKARRQRFNAGNVL